MDPSEDRVELVFRGFPAGLPLRTGPDGRLFSSASARRTVKHLAETAGLPHTEIGSVETSGRTVTMDHLPAAGERIVIFPKDHSRRPAVPPAFILDVHLGKLSRLLRLVGFDAAYRNDLDDEEIVETALIDNRTILTRDRGLLMRKAVAAGYLVQGVDPFGQLVGVLRDFGLKRKMRPFSRCVSCGGVLHQTDKILIADILPDVVRKRYRRFLRCPSCGNVYWRGDHFRNIDPFLKRLRAEFKGSKSGPEPRKRKIAR